jgi:hypothetical protein
VHIYYMQNALCPLCPSGGGGRGVVSALITGCFGLKRCDQLSLRTRPLQMRFLVEITFFGVARMHTLSGCVVDSDM